MTFASYHRPALGIMSGAFVAALAAGCAQVESKNTEELQSSSAAIQGGAATTAYPFSVGIAIVRGSGFGTCTGTLIAPNLVLTARHCVAAVSTGETIDCSSNFGASYPASSFYVTTDPTIRQRSNYVVANRVDVTADPQACGNDIALLRLSENITGVTLGVPVVQHKIYNRSRYSQSVAAVGYGVTNAFANTGDSGTRRIRRPIPILCTDGSSLLGACSPVSPSSLSAKDIVTGPGTCSGDSGSAAFDDTTLDSATPYVFGVLSRGGANRSTGECGEAIYTRVDEHADFIIRNALLAATAGGYDAPSWTLAVAPEPGDAPYVPPPAVVLKKQGESCTLKRECDGGSCVNFGDDRGNVCASGCPNNTDEECSTGYQCVSKFCQLTPAPVVEPVTEPELSEPVTAETPATAAPATASAPTITTTTTSCSAREVDPTHPQPWYAGAAVLGAVLAAGRRRRQN